MLGCTVLGRAQLQQAPAQQHRAVPYTLVHCALLLCALGFISAVYTCLAGAIGYQHGQVTQSMKPLTGIVIMRPLTSVRDGGGAILLRLKLQATTAVCFGCVRTRCRADDVALHRR
jgi:hypothetical protein